MSLDFSFAKCAKVNGENVYDMPGNPEKWHPVAEQLAFVTMVIGMREITDKNAEKFAQRLSLYQRITGPLIRFGDGTKAYITLEDVEQHIGMATNASALTDAQFAKHMVEVASRYMVGNRVRHDDKPDEYETARDIVARQIAKYAKKEVATT